MMSRLPEIVTWRMKANTLATEGSHPDFGVLTAFIEGSLVGKRRNELFLHLASCSECNRLVSLATPVEEQKVRQPKRTWTLWNLVPVPKFSVPALGTAALLLAVWALHIPTVEGPAVRVTPAPATVASVPSATSTLPSAAETQVAELSSPAPRLARTAKATHEKAPQSSFPSQFEALSPNAANVTMQTPVLPPAPLVAPHHAPSPAPVVSSVAAPPAGPCWRVSDAGTLQKSGTCGIEWQDVSLGAPVTVRVMQSVASNVWVGGNSGALFHSEDGGSHWNRINVPMLTEDIVAIVFATPAEGKLATADGSIWATNDGGQTWRRR